MWRLLLLLLFLSIPVSAQDDIPIITPENAAGLTEIAYIGGTLPGDLVWSPDGKTLAIGTSDGVKLYSPVDGTVIEGDVKTLDAWLNPPVPEPVFEHFESSVDEAGNLVVTVTHPLLGEPVTVPTGYHARLVGGVIALGQPIAAWALQQDFPEDQIVLQIFDLEQNALITELPQPFEFLHTLKFTTDGGALIINTYTDAIYGDRFEETNVYALRMPQTVENGYYTGTPVFYGDYTAYASDGNIVLWNGSQGQKLECHDASFGNPKFTADGRYVVASPYPFEGVYIWDVAAPTICRSLAASSSMIGLSPDGKRVAVSSWGSPNKVDILDIESGEILQTIEGERIVESSFSDDWRFLRSGTKFWNVETGQKLIEVEKNALVSKDWSYAAWWVDGVVRAVDVAAAKTTDLKIIESDLGDVVAFNPVKEWAVLSAGELKVIELETGETLHTFPQRESVVFSDDGARLVFGREGDLPFQMWDTSKMDAPLLEGNFPANLISPDYRFVSALYLGGSVGSGSRGGTLFFSDLENSTQVIQMTEDYNENDHAFSPDSKKFAYGFGYGFISIVDLEIFVKEKLSEFEAPAESVFVLPPYTDVVKLQFSPDSRYLAAQVNPGELMPGDEYEVEVTGLYVLEGAEERLFIPDVTLLGFSADGSLLTGGDTTIQLRNIETGEVLAEVDGGLAAAFSPDGAILATYDGEFLRLWDVSAPDTALVTIENTDYQVSEIAFNADGSRLYVVGAAGVRIYWVN